MSATTAARTALERHTRRPTGLPSWPILLLAGREKSGKSWSCAEASGSDLIGRTLWVSIGEDDPDEYALVPGADFEIVEHTGTYRDILAAAQWCADQTSEDGRPTLIVLDSGSRLWDLLSDMAQDDADARVARKAARERKPVPAEDADTTPLEWNVAADRWGHIIDALRKHQGPALVTARLEEVAVMVKGKPTGDTQMKVKAHKSLPYDAAGIVELPERGSAYLTGVRTARMEVPHRIPLPGFTVDKLWRRLGLAEVEVGERRHSRITPADLTQAPTADERGGPDTGEASRIAHAVTRTSDLDGLRAAWRDASTAELLPVNIQAAVAHAEAAVAGVPADDQYLLLGDWIKACVRHVTGQNCSVADSVALAQTDPWDVPPDAPASPAQPEPVEATS